jgi:hypothetical protein
MAKVKGITVLKLYDDGGFDMHVSGAAAPFVAQAIEKGLPHVKAELSQRELKQGQVALERLEAAMREVKQVQFKNLQEEARLAALKTPPGDRLQ